jgi:hypothetical protein
MDLGRVFISSVFKDMLELRKLAADSARLLGIRARQYGGPHSAGRHGMNRVVTPAWFRSQFRTV